MKMPTQTIVAAGLFVCLSILAQLGQTPGQTAAAPPPNSPPPKQPADAAKIERLIRQLGSEHFTEREAASKALEAIGDPVLPALRKIQGNSDLEVRRRVAALLKVLEQKRLRMRAKGLEAIRRFGGYSVTEDETPNGRTRWVGFDGPAATGAGDAEAAWLPYFDDAQYLSLSETRIGDDGLVYIETFCRLRGLSLRGNKTVTDAGLKHVRKLVTLTYLGLDDTRLTGAGFLHLKNLQELVRFDLAGSSITDAGLEHLKKLKKLAALDLRLTRVTDKGLGHLSEITTLAHLDLFHTQVTDAGLAKLKHLKSLTWLDLSETRITDAGLVHLKEIQTLKWLRLENTKVTERGKSELRKSLPKLSLVK